MTQPLQPAMDVAPQKIIVGLSGGVDSAVAAQILKQQGHSVSAVFMKNWDEDDDSEYCTARADFEDAQRIADHIDIPLHPVNFAAEYWDRVFADFLKEYRAGRTPNPDVLCNRFIKFDVFLQYAEVLGADAIATGHYATIRRHAGSTRLFRAKDSAKDQTYFLQGVLREKFDKCLFPLNSMFKSEVRNFAYESGIHVYEKRDSTGICFIGERRFRDFLQRWVPHDSGAIVNDEGVVVGEHVGLAFYTIGQRQGIGLGGMKGAAELPWYVVAKRTAANELVVSQNQSHLMATCLTATQPNWLCDEPERIERCHATIRYRGRAAPCAIQHETERLTVHFHEPQRAITAGQHVAFYQNDQCLGGALIES